jgi:micrococcal nuclease
MRRSLAAIGLLTVLALAVPSVPSVPSPARVAPPPSQAPATTAPVLRVVDGDTVVLALDGRPVHVRLIGVDTPETVHPRKPVERFGREAAAFLRALIEGKDVRVTYEDGPSRLDRYGRTLAYLHLEPGGLFVNREIIARGYGFAYTKYPFRHMDDFRAAERAAREAPRGLWGPGPDPAVSPASGTVYVTRTGSKYHRAGCRYVVNNKGAVAMALDQAAARRYAPCSVCDPPTPAVGAEGAGTSGGSRPRPTPAPTR